MSQDDSDYDDYESGYYDEQYARWKKDRMKRYTVYRENYSGSETERYERENGRWARRDAESREFKNVDYAGVCIGMGTVIFGTANNMLLANGIGKSAEVPYPSAKRVHCETKPITSVLGVNILGAEAEAKAGNAPAGASVTPIQAEAYAKVSGAEADAHAYLIEGITEANARVVVAEAQAKAGAGLKSLGAEAG